MHTSSMRRRNSSARAMEFDSSFKASSETQALPITVFSQSLCIAFPDRRNEKQSSPLSSGGCAPSSACKRASTSARTPGSKEKWSVVKSSSSPSVLCSCGGTEVLASLVVDHAAQHRVARDEHGRAADLVDAALFAREQIAHGHGLPRLDREHFPDAQPGALLREKPRALIRVEAGAALLEEPADDRAAFHLEAVDRPWTEELHGLRRVGEIAGRAGPGLAETPLRIAPHLCDEVLVSLVHRRRRGRRGGFQGRQAALLVFLARAAGARLVASHLLRRGRGARIVLGEEMICLVRRGEAHRQPAAARPRLADGVSLPRAREIHA